jgi:hypothetical protein
VPVAHVFMLVSSFSPRILPCQPQSSPRWTVTHAEEYSAETMRATATNAPRWIKGILEHRTSRVGGSFIWARITAGTRVGRPRGLLNPRAGEKWFRLSRHLPAQDLRFLRGALLDRRVGPEQPEALPSREPPPPSVNLVIERGRSRIYGVETRGESSYLLKSKGRVFGMIKQARRCQNI